jgi:hypothetical protein
MLSITRPTTPQLADPVYSPLDDRRRCAHCSRRDGWIRIEDGPIVGGWICACSDLPEIKHDPRELRHVCTVACAIGGAA